MVITLGSEDHMATNIVAVLLLVNTFFWENRQHVLPDECTSAEHTYSFCHPKIKIIITKNRSAALDTNTPSMPSQIIDSDWV